MESVVLLELNWLNVVVTLLSLMLILMDRSIPSKSCIYSVSKHFRMK